MLHRLQQLLADKELKEGRRMTLKEHADEMEIHPRSLSRWLDSDSPPTRFDQDIIVSFCKYFKVDVGDILYYVSETDE